MPGIRVLDVRIAEQGRWRFRASQLTWGPPGRPGLTAVFDPFPAYPHDRGTAEAAARAAQERCPPLWDVGCYLADREEDSRTNGYSALDDGHYEGSEWVPDRAGLIVLSGKRTPPHPAVTRHLIAHEYGHSVAFMLNSLREDCRHASSTDPLYRDYAQARGLPEASLHHGEGGAWHDSACEVFADDFRLLVLRAEPGHWPHPGIPRPGHVPGLHDWWDRALAQLAQARDRPAVS